MKITSAQYAKALYAMTAEKNPAEVDLMVENFIKILQKNNQMKLARNIVEKFSTVHNSNHSVVEAMVVSASPLDAVALKNIEDFIIRKYAAKKVVLKNSIEKRIKGGIIIKVGDEMMDASVIRKISDLRMALIK